MQPFPGPGGRSRVSTTGGAQPRWRGDGQELFYVGLDGQMMGVSIRRAQEGEAVEIATPEPLFLVHTAEGPVPSTNKQQYAVSADGQRFLMNLAIDGALAPPISIVLNWGKE